MSFNNILWYYFDVNMYLKVKAMELSFSQRMGYKEVRTIFQTEDMDEALRNSLWNYCYKKLFYNVFGQVNLVLISDMWTDFFKRKYLSADSNLTSMLGEYYNYFKSSQWYEVYDLLEFIVNSSSFNSHTNYRDNSYLENRTNDINKILEKEMSGYRFEGSKLTPITDDNELSSIAEALNNDRTKIHMQRALEMLSDRNNPDYRNSIKESISAVEAICRKITGEESLGKALDHIKKHNSVDMNGQFRAGLEKIYSYTNNKETGIRHALLDENKEITFDDAKFMLVICSAFVNYFTAKASNV